MKNRITTYIFIILLIASAASAEKYFVLDLNYISGSLTFNSISLKEVERTVDYTDTSGFQIKLKSFDDLDLEKIHYDMQSNRNYQIYLPYNKEASRIEVYNPSNSKVMDIEVASFSDTCGNNVCEDHESYESCTKDCSSGSKDDFCDGIDDGICDPDCIQKNDADCGKSREPEASSTPPATPVKKPPIKTPAKKTAQAPNYMLGGSMIAAAIIPILIFTFVRKRKQQAIIDTLKEYIMSNIQRGFSLQQIKNTLYQQGYTEREIDTAVRSI